MRKLIICLILIYLPFNPLSGQEAAKTFSLGENEELRIVDESENYVVVRTFDKQSNLYNVYVLDTLGISRFNLLNLRRDVVLSRPIESLNLLLLIRDGNGYDSDPKLRDDLLRGYSLKTGEIVWETTSIASSYEISPNKRFAVTNGVFTAESSKETPLRIIDLVDGSSKQTVPNLVNCYTNWLDNERIIIIQKQKDYTEEYKEFQKTLEDIDNREKAIYKERKLLQAKVSRGEITQQYLKDRTQTLNQERADIEEEIYQIGNIMPKRKYRYLASNLMIYNYVYNRIELNTNLYSENRKEFCIDPSGFSEVRGRVLLDKDKNIYLTGFIYDSPNQAVPTFAKFNRSGIIQWSKDIRRELSYRIFPMRYNGDAIFRIKKNDQIYIIDNNSGVLQSSIQHKNDQEFYSLISDTKKQKAVPSNRFRISADEKDITFTGNW